MFDRNSKWLCVVFSAACMACGSSHSESKAGAVGEAAGSAGRAGKGSFSGSGAGGASEHGPQSPTIPTLMCDPAAVAQANCGSQVCPEIPSALAAACTLTCCTADARCGTRTTLVQFPNSQCVATAVEDSRCPSMLYSGSVYPGCCDALNHCGQLFGSTCIAIPTGTQPATARDCDALAAPDAGS